MWIPVLAILAGVELIVLIVLIRAVTQKTRALDLARQELNDERRRGEELKTKLEERTRQADEFRGKLERSREEAKRAKKKAFELEQEEKQAPDEEEAERVREAELLEAKAEAKRALETAARAAEEAQKQRTAADKLKADLLEAKRIAEEKAARARELEAAPAPAAPTGGDPKARIASLEAEIGKLQFKLDTAQKKARNDAQVYRVTKSKLDLALEKLNYLEAKLKVLGNGKAEPAPEPPPEPAPDPEPDPEPKPDA